MIFRRTTLFVGLRRLAGNAVIPTIDAACRIAKAQGVPLLISGGIGHSTPFLYAVIARHPRYHTIRTSGRAEAAILADIANQFWHIPAEKIWLEDRSTNCGENARFSCALIRQAKENINTAIVVQDPTMQRRAIAAFRRVTNDDTDAPRWLSFLVLFRYCATLMTVHVLPMLKRASGRWSVICL